MGTVPKAVEAVSFNMVLQVVRKRQQVETQGVACLAHPSEGHLLFNREAVDLQSSLHACQCMFVFCMCAGGTCPRLLRQQNAVYILTRSLVLFWLMVSGG